MDKKLVFGIKEGDGVTYLTLSKKRINVPPFGPMTAEQVMEREDVLRHLVASRSVFPVLRELTEEELAEYEAGLEELSADIPEGSEEEEGDELSLEAAQAEYETLTGKKPGTMKLETLLKKIEAAKSKTD